MFHSPCTEQTMCLCSQDDASIQWRLNTFSHQRLWFLLSMYRLVGDRYFTHLKLLNSCGSRDTVVFHYMGFWEGKSARPSFMSVILSKSDVMVTGSLEEDWYHGIHSVWSEYGFLGTHINFFPSQQQDSCSLLQMVLAASRNSGMFVPGHGSKEGQVCMSFIL